MKEEKIKKLLNELADATQESAPSHLAEDIKHQIPHLSPHKGGMDTINIIIDLRISKLAAAAAIIVTMILFASFLGSRGPESDGLLKDSKLLIKYCLGDIDAGKESVSAARSRYEQLAQRFKDVVYYEDSIDKADSNAILMHWKLPNGNYKVVFGDLHEEMVTAEELINLQALMLQKNEK